MAYPIEQKLVVAVSATALFDLSEEHAFFLKHGVDKFRALQRDRKNDIPALGAAYPFIKGLLNFNKAHGDERPVEVVILSRHHPDAGLRVMNAVEHYGLGITRANFLGGQMPYPYMSAYNAVLYLSTNEIEVEKAIRAGYPAGLVLPCRNVVQEPGPQLRIAFDFDGVIVDDEAETIYTKSKNLDLFHDYERKNRDKPLKSGPLLPLMQRISILQKAERAKSEANPDYLPLIQVAIITARNAPSHERLLNTLDSLGIEHDQLLLTGGIEKKRFLDVFSPHIFFDDQLGHLLPAADTTPSVHIPFGIKNNGG
jgi:5'-nucleotidase